MPFGFDGVFCRLMEIGIGWMVAVAQWVAACPAPPAAWRRSARAVIATSMGLVLLGLLRTRCAGSAADRRGGDAMGARPAAAGILVAGDGRAVAVRGKDGRLRLMRAAMTPSRRAPGSPPTPIRVRPTDASLSEGVSCDASGCVVPAVDGRLVALALAPDAFAATARVRRSSSTARQDAGGLRGDGVRSGGARGQGALALRRSGDGYAVTATRPRGTDRPWARGIAEDAGAAETARRSPRPLRVIDATPADADLQADD